MALCTLFGCLTCTYIRSYRHCKKSKQANKQEPGIKQILVPGMEADSDILAECLIQCLLWSVF